jgi:hypothetical protein
MEDMAEEAHRMELVFKDRMEELILIRNNLTQSCNEKDEKI